MQASSASDVIAAQRSRSREGIREQLLQARDVLEIGLQNVSDARHAVARTDGKAIADISWAQVGPLHTKNLHCQATHPSIKYNTAGMVSQNNTDIKSRLVLSLKGQYSGPCDLRPLHFTVPSILKPAISDTILIFSIQISLYFKTTSNLRPKFHG